MIVAVGLRHLILAAALVLLGRALWHTHRRRRLEAWLAMWNGFLVAAFAAQC